MYSKRGIPEARSLFFVTLITTTFAGGELGPMGSQSWPNWEMIFFTLAILLEIQWPYSIPFLGILLIHWAWPFSFTSIYHKVKCLWHFFYSRLAWFYWCLHLLELLEAVIRWKVGVNSRKKFFDIGVAGPIGGFCCCFGQCLPLDSWLYPGSYSIRFILNIADPEFQGYGEEFEFWS